EGDEQQRINTYIVGFQYDLPFLREAAEADRCGTYTSMGDCANDSYNPNNYFDLGKDQKRYFSATNPKKLKDYLVQIIYDIIKRTSSSVAVAVSISTSESRSEDYVVRARFDPKGWRGLLESFQLPYEMGTSKAVWEAGARLGTETRDFDDKNSLRDLDDLAQDRKIYTADTSTTPPTRVDFKKDNSWLLARLNDPTWLGTSSLNNDETKALVSWVRGEYVEGNLPSGGFLPDKYPGILKERVEGWRLFDIIYSTPLVLGAPNAWYETESIGTNSYLNFAEAYEGRERMAFVGSNDGLLHAFKLVDTCAATNTYGSCTRYVEPNCGTVDADQPWECGGWEKWAYIPSNLLPYLRYKAHPGWNWCHSSGVDLTIVKTDILMDFTNDGKDNPEWGSVLVTGEREGGNNYFCLNITDSDRMTTFTVGIKNILWEYSNKEQLGDSIAAPEIGLVNKAKTGADIGPHWVAFLTTSTNSTSGLPYIVPLDIATGQPFDWGRDGPGNDAIEVVDESLHITATPPLTSCCAIDDFVMDKKYDDLTDTIYFGDSQGRVWKMTVGSGTNGLENDWKPYVIFEAKDVGERPQPISVPIVVAPNINRQSMLFFGTGRYSEKDDITSTQTQTFYALIDKGIKYGISTATITKGNLDKLEFRGVWSDCVFDEQTGDYKFSGIATRTVVKTIDVGTESELGWYIDFNLRGCAPPGLPNTPEYQAREKTTEPALVYAGIVFFTSFIPTTQPCSAGGVGYVHAMNYRTGKAPETEVLEKKGKFYIKEVGTLCTTSVYLGQGVPSRP
ncbi:MAG: PilC/PilY family type IV pilus protein, partial [bacterium]